MVGKNKENVGFIATETLRQKIELNNLCKIMEGI